MTTNNKPLIVEFNVPGYSADQIEVTTEPWLYGSLITVVAKNDKRGERFGQWRVQKEYDAQNTQANVENGLLTLTIPVHESAQPKRIQVSAPLQLAQAQN